MTREQMIDAAVRASGLKRDSLPYVAKFVERQIAGTQRRDDVSAYSEVDAIRSRFGSIMAGLGYQRGVVYVPQGPRP